MVSRYSVILRYPRYTTVFDGHGFRAGSKDLLYAVNEADVFQTNPDGTYQITWGVPQKRTVGRADFSGLPFGDELTLMGAWLDLNDAFRRGAFVYDRKSVMLCGLDGLDPSMGNRLITILEGVTGPGSVIDTRTKFAFKQFFTDAKYTGRSFLAGAFYDGGEPFGIGEYNVGGAADFASGLVKTAVMLLFCSNGWHTDDWYLQRAALVGGSLAVIYGTWDPPALAAWSDSVPIGVAFQNRGAVSYTVTGDVMLLKPPVSTESDDMSQADLIVLRDEFNAFKAETRAKFAAMGEIVVPDNPPPPGTNYAREVGVTATASSSIPNYGPEKAINGDSRGSSYNAGGAWATGVKDHYPEWLRVTLAGPRDINRVVVISVPDDYEHKGEPSDTDTFSLYGLVDFTVRALVGSTWQTVGTVTANNQVKRTVPFPTVVGALAVEINVTKGKDGYVRVVEAQVFGP